MNGKLAVITGPSGAGKDTLLSLFLQKHSDWQQPPSVTTRSIRPGEIDGVHMKFVNAETFEQWQKEDKFLETDFHAGNWYGTLSGPIEELLTKNQNVLLRKDVNGALQIKVKLPQAVTIFIEAESFDVLEKHIRERGSESEAQIQERLELAKRELELADRFDHRIVNATGKLDQSLAELEKILFDQ